MDRDGLGCSGSRAVAVVVEGVLLIKSPTENQPQDTQEEESTTKGEDLNHNNVGYILSIHSGLSFFRRERHTF
jgi:hypothetical protein